jgi:hypothetical protein
MQPRRVVLTAVMSALLVPAALFVALPGRAQESVADAARKAQATKKPSTKPVPVFTNDNLDTVKGTISIVGEAPAAPANPPGTSDKDKAADKSKAPATVDKTQAKGEDYWRKTFADARKKLADDARELDVLQREYSLKQQQYYSDPNMAMREQFSRQDLAETKTKIDDRTAVVAADKQSISDLEDQLRQAGGEPGWANP